MAGQEWDGEDIIEWFGLSALMAREKAWSGRLLLYGRRWEWSPAVKHRVWRDLARARYAQEGSSEFWRRWEDLCLSPDGPERDPASSESVGPVIVEISFD